MQDRKNTKRAMAEITFVVSVAQTLNGVLRAVDIDAVAHVLRDELAGYKDRAREWDRTHVARVDAARAIRAALNDAPRLSAATRTWLMNRLGLHPDNSAESHENSTGGGPGAAVRGETGAAST